jgi:hypothetical protein
MRRRINKYFPLRMILAIIPVLFLFSLPVNAQYNENIIKAAYIERITRFIEWPVEDTTLSSDRFVLCVYGETQLYNTLIDIFKEKLIKNHKVNVIAIKTPEQLSTCNICYISEKAKPIINDFVNTANSSGVLLISETTDFCKAGVHINFYIEDEKLKFEINVKSLTSAGFKVSYLLMKNTRIIQ